MELLHRSPCTPDCSPLVSFQCQLWGTWWLVSRFPSLMAINVLSDNMLALLWLHNMATTLLSHPCLALLHFRNHEHWGQCPQLSCFQHGWLTSWEDVIKLCSLLKTCQICLLPESLLSVLVNLSSLQPIMGMFDELTMNLLTHELHVLPPGLNLKDIHSSLLPL